MTQLDIVPILVKLPIRFCSDFGKDLLRSILALLAKFYSLKVAQCDSQKFKKSSIYPPARPVTIKYGGFKCKNKQKQKINKTNSCSYVNKNSSSQVNSTSIEN
jgi:hypothetical protein